MNNHIDFINSDVPTRTTQNNSSNVYFYQAHLQGSPEYSEDDAQYIEAYNQHDGDYGGNQFDYHTRNYETQFDYDTACYENQLDYTQSDDENQYGYSES